MTVLNKDSSVQLSILNMKTRLNFLVDKASHKSCGFLAIFTLLQLIDEFIVLILFNSGISSIILALSGDMPGMYY